MIVHQTIAGGYLVVFECREDLDGFREAWSAVMEAEGYDEAVARVEDLTGRYRGYCEGKVSEGVRYDCEAEYRRSIVGAVDDDIRQARDERMRKLFGL